MPDETTAPRPARRAPTRAASTTPPRAPKPAARPAAKPATPARRRAKAAPTRDVTALWDRLLATHPDAHCELDFRTPFELLVATILSAQCTDRRVNMVTPALFARFPDARALAAAPLDEVEALVRTTGFFRAKAKNLVAMANALVAEHGGEVPADMDALVRLPGVGRKTANVVLGDAFGIGAGVVVDTHVARLSRRLGLAQADDPVRIEAELSALFPRERWTMLSHLLIFHGRRTCDARRPRCEGCALRELCPSAT